MAHTIKALLTQFDDAYTRKYGVKAPIIGSKDAPLAKRLLGLYTPEQLSHWIDVFFTMRDPFIERSGHTFGVFSACIAKVIAASTPVKTSVPVETFGHAARIRAQVQAEWGEK